jgi:hypothetical protein
VGYFFIGKQKIVLFPKYRKNGWKSAASALTLILRSQFLHPDVARAFSPCCGGEGWECEKEDCREKGKMAEMDTWHCFIGLTWQLAHMVKNPLNFFNGI